MTNEKQNAKTPAQVGADGVDVRDMQLEEALKGTYDSMDPTAEQEERMLAALMQAQAQIRNRHGEEPVTDGGKKASAQESDGSGSEKARLEKGQEDSEKRKAAKKRSSGFGKWKVALPLAACLVLGAVIIGVASAPTAEQFAGSETEPAPLQSSSPTGEKGVEAVTEGAVEVETGVIADSEPLAALGSASEAYECEALTDEGGIDAIAIDDVDFNTEEYSAVKETGFVSTKANPLSTVSADVDTASYCNLRRMINEGYTLSNLPSGSVRIEEMLNYFTYDYATPTGSDLFSIQAHASQCPWNADAQLLVLGFATAPESQAASKGSNLVFLIDVSGSMDSPDKLDLLQDSFATLLESLGSDDRVSIVTYAS